jgi:hypothetical protein
MSSKNNVNPDHYKVAGRDKPDDNIPPQRPVAPAAGKKNPARRDEAPPNFIPGAAPVGKPDDAKPETTRPKKTRASRR